MFLEIISRILPNVEQRIVNLIRTLKLLKKSDFLNVCVCFLAADNDGDANKRDSSSESLDAAMVITIAVVAVVVVFALILAIILYKMR